MRNKENEFAAKAGSAIDSLAGNAIKSLKPCFPSEDVALREGDFESRLHQGQKVTSLLEGLQNQITTYLEELEQWLEPNKVESKSNKGWSAKIFKHRVQMEAPELAPKPIDEDVLDNLGIDNN